jgi:chromate transport protein ChrA
MTKNTKKQKILLTLIFLVPFALLVTNNPIIESLLVIYAGYFIYLVIDKDIIHLELPEVGYPETKTKTTTTSESELPGLSNVRQAEQNIHDELNKTLAKKVYKKPTIKKVSKK